jgi:hypothetical protein
MLVETGENPSPTTPNRTDHSSASSPGSLGLGVVNAVAFRALLGLLGNNHGIGTDLARTLRPLL